MNEVQYQKQLSITLFLITTNMSVTKEVPGVSCFSEAWNVRPHVESRDCFGELASADNTNISYYNTCLHKHYSYWKVVHSCYILKLCEKPATNLSAMNFYSIVFMFSILKYLDRLPMYVGGNMFPPAR